MDDRHRSAGANISRADSGVEPVDPPETNAALIAQASYFEGPLPHPDLLRQFEQLRPGATEFFMSEVAKNAEHRRAMQERALAADIQDQRSQRSETRRAQVCAVALIVFALITAAIIIIQVPTAAGASVAGVIGGTAIGSILAAFLIGAKAAKMHDQGDNDDSGENE